MRFIFFPTKQPRHHHKKERNKNQVDKGGREQAAGNSGADGVLGSGPGSFGQRQRQGAEEEGQRGHDDRAEPDLHCRQGRLDQFMSFMHLRLDELDDEDGVLGGKADGGQQTDLEIDIIGEHPQLDRHHRPHQSQRQHQQVDEGDGPALVQGRHGEKHHQQRDGVECRRLGAGLLFLVGETGPFITDADRQLRHHLLHLGHGFAGADSRRRLPHDLHRRNAVITLQPG